LNQNMSSDFRVSESNKCGCKGCERPV
jgi:hypothetical protein